MPVKDQGIGEMFNDLQAEAGIGTVVTEHVNTSDAAAYLQARDGYFVYNDAALADIHSKHAAKLVKGDKPLTRDRVIENQKEAAREAVGFHKAYAGGTKPPLKTGGPSRPIRAGSWADRRGVTADSFDAFTEGERVSSLPGPEGQDLR